MFCKKLLFSFTALCFPLLMNAQVGAVADAVLPINVELGLKAGANFQKLDGAAWDDAYRTGLVGGAFGGVKFKRLGVTAEVLLSRVKFTTTGKDLYNNFKSNYNNPADSAKVGEFAVTNISVPVLLNAKVFGPLWLQIGPQFTSALSVSDDNSLLKDPESIFKSDVSGVVGLELNLPMKVKIGARYIMGFSDVNPSSTGDSWKNRTIQLHVGYSFL